MRASYPIGAVCLLLVALQLSEGQEPAKDIKIELVKVKMKELVETHIASQKGKVVVINLWAFYHVPTKHEFSKFVQLHEKYADKGVVCISISVDEGDEFRKRALQFLREKKARFANYWIEEGVAVLQKQWGYEALLPAVVVYGRDGKLAKIFNNEDFKKEPFSHKDVEIFVKKIVETK